MALGYHVRGAKDIVEEFGLDKQTTYHILQSLNAIGLNIKSIENRSVLGLKVADLIENFPRHLAPPEHLAPLVRALSQETGETAYPVGWVQGEIVALSATRGTKSVSASEVPQGYASNAYARALGKLLLALVDPTQAAVYLKRHELR